MTRKILVVAPHPDDEVLGCGGTIAKLSRFYEHVHILIVTRGDDLFDQGMIETGRKEALEAHKLLGAAKTHFADLPAIKLDTLPHYQINSVLSGFLREIQPQILLIPFSGDINKDHQIVHECCMVAARPFDTSVTSIYCYETPSSTNWNSPGMAPGFAPNTFVDITSEIDLKLEAVRTFASQLKEFPHERSTESVMALSKYRGGFVSLRHAEAFMCIRDIKSDAADF